MLKLIKVGLVAVVMATAVLLGGGKAWSVEITMDCSLDSLGTLKNRNVVLKYKDPWIGSRSVEHRKNGRWVKWDSPLLHEQSSTLINLEELKIIHNQQLENMRRKNDPNYSNWKKEGEKLKYWEITLQVNDMSSTLYLDVFAPKLQKKMRFFTLIADFKTRTLEMRLPAEAMTDVSQSTKRTQCSIIDN